jgi:hypothetical protein
MPSFLSVLGELCAFIAILKSSRYFQNINEAGRGAPVERSE